MKKITILALLIFTTAFGIVYLKHNNRQLLIDLHARKTEHDTLNSEWSQLLLEESTLSTHSRIERIATNELKMYIPKDNEIIWINEQKTP